MRYLIDAARQRVAGAVNAELTQLYWQIGRRIDKELLQGQRAEYGKQVISELARLLTAEFGKGWSEQQLRHCLRMAEVYNDEQILSTVWRELSWSHLKRLIYIDDPLKRDFYFEICRLERWSVRQLQERIKSLLYERTAISRKPEDTIRQDLDRLRDQGQLSPDLTFRDPYALDFLGLSDSCSVLSPSSISNSPVFINIGKGKEKQSAKQPTSAVKSSVLTAKPFMMLINLTALSGSCLTRPELTARDGGLHSLFMTA